MGGIEHKIRIIKIEKRVIIEIFKFNLLQVKNKNMYERIRKHNRGNFSSRLLRRLFPEKISKGNVITETYTTKCGNEMYTFTLKLIINLSCLTEGLIFVNIMNKRGKLITKNTKPSGYIWLT